MTQTVAVIWLSPRQHSLQRHHRQFFLHFQFLRHLPLRRQHLTDVTIITTMTTITTITRL
jgi:hypothetical protein